MTVLDSTPRDQYTASGGQTVFTYTFEIAAAGDIKVLQNGTLINQGAGAGEYAVSGVGVDTGGNVTLVTGATAGDILTIYRDMALERLTAYTNAGDFLAADVNNDFDRLWLALQQNGGDLDGRVLIAPNTDPTGIDMTIPDKATRLDKYLKFNVTTGNPEVADPTALFTSAGLNHYNFTGDGTTVNFTLGMVPGGENNTQVYIDGVYQQKNTYNVSGAIVQFSAAPPSLSTIEVMVIEVLPIGATTASQVSFTQAGSTYGRNVQLKLQESVSVTDFGAVGDGDTNDTAAIVLALAAGNGAMLSFEQGKTYLVNDLSYAPTTLANALSGIEGNGAILKSAAGTTTVLTITNPHASVSAPIRFAVTNLTVDGAGIATNGIRIHGSQYCRYSGIQTHDCVSKGFWRDAEAGYGIYYNDFEVLTQYNGAGNATDGGWVSITSDATFRLASNRNRVVSIGNNGCGLISDYEQDDYAYASFEQNQLIGWQINNTRSMGVMGGYSENNNLASTPDTSFDLLNGAVGSRGVKITGGRHIGAIGGAGQYNPGNEYSPTTVNSYIVNPHTFKGTCAVGGALIADGLANVAGVAIASGGTLDVTTLQSELVANAVYKATLTVTGISRFNVVYFHVTGSGGGIEMVGDVIDGTGDVIWATSMSKVQITNNNASTRNIYYSLLRLI